MSHPVEIPRHVDDPPTLLLWRIDDLVPVVLMLMLVLGILADQLLVFLLLGIVLVRLRALPRQPPGRLGAALGLLGGVA
jgi:type IV conjugative transfer system protein TraL